MDQLMTSSNNNTLRITDLTGKIHYEYRAWYHSRNNAIEWCMNNLPEKSYQIYGGGVYFTKEKYKTLFLLADV